MNLPRFKRLALSVLLIFAFLCVGCAAGDGDSSDDNVGSDGGGNVDTGGGDTASNPQDSSSSFSGAKDLDAFITSTMQTGHIPGLAISIVKGDEVLYSKGYGLADIASSTPVSTDTVFLLASASKAVTAVGVMQLVEIGGLKLDDDISSALTFSVRNPNFPDVPITVRQLLAHVSGVQDDVDLLDSLSVDGDSPIPLADFVRGYFLPGGVYYNAAHNWLTRAPGTKYQFTDSAFALAGYIAESVSSRSFADYARQAIFRPLGMSNTSFTLSGLNGTAKLATPYHFNGQSFVALNQYGFPDYPDGLVRTSARDLSRFLIALINGGSFQSSKILSGSSVSEIERIQFPLINRSQGIGMYYKSFGTTQLFGHGGEHRGASAEMFYVPSSNVGVLLLANVDGVGDSLLGIEQRMLQLAGS
ncbi:MAG: serine hydrolase domain-containing protein [Bdellovibrionota bacterium]